MVSAAAISKTVGEAVREAATGLRPDARAALESALKAERSERGREVLEQLIENARVAENDRVPLCQDTGTVWVRVELGEGECVEGDLQAAVDKAAAEAYADAGLRMSVVRDAAVDRSNTGSNTPAFVEVAQRPGPGATVHVMLKGGGSDNASALRMLDPAAGLEGVEEFLVEIVAEKASSACPPLVIGVAIGGTFDTVAGMAKKALLRPVGSAQDDPALLELEARLLDRVNATGIGPAGLGGDTTALAVHVVSAPSHIAALPVAVNLGCSAMRSVSVDVR
jgi:tartrate/fumarate subfamily iron-sulfur-dependent hydro-lyase alpha chain